MQDSTLIKGFESDYFLRDPDAAVDAMRKNKEGVPLPPERFPKENFPVRAGKLFKKMPEIFDAGGYWVVSKEFADVLRRFDMGRTSFYPTELFQYDRKRRIEGEYFCLSFGETKSVFIPEESEAKLVNAGRNWWLPSATFADDSIAVTSAARTGVDLWLDERLRMLVFFSAPLVEALRAAKLTRRLKLKTCRVILLH
jgi:hypothetical protein